jgi:drug/metabolite transporter (DMT)-like permease
MTHVPSADRLRALSMLVLATFFWGLSFPLIKSIILLHAKLLPHASTSFWTVYTVAPRFLLGVLIIWALHPRDSWRATALEWKQGIIIGGFSAAGMLFQNDGLQFTHASTSAFLTQFYAILIPVWVAFRSRRNPGALVWTCCALVLGGVAILGQFDWHALRLGRGEIETLISSLFFMGQILTLSRPDFAGNRPERITLIMFATQALVFWTLVPNLAPDVEAMFVPWTSPIWLAFTLVLTVLCTYGAYSLMNTWQPKITATEAGLIYCVEPVFGSLMALFLPAVFSTMAGVSYGNETGTWTLLVGGGLITLANVLLQFNPPPKETPLIKAAVVD